MQPSNIAWCDYTWNPTHGCSHVSDGCTNCYAERLSLRHGHTDHEWTTEYADENVQVKPHKLKEPVSVTETSDEDWTMPTSQRASTRSESSSTR
jgi:protein gp37